MKFAVSQILDNGRLVPIRANASQGLVVFNNGGDWSLSTNGTTITPSHTTVNVGAKIDGTEHYALIASGLGPSAAAAGTPSVPERLRARETHRKHPAIGHRVQSPRAPASHLRQERADEFHR